MQQKYLNEIIAAQKHIDDEIFWSYCKYQNQSILVKDLIRANQARHKQLVTNINDGLTDIRNTIH